ncbi:MAG TPA: alpha/beta fold hydrolase, partial [Thermomicrobiales bacterium]|nr:alpha/beta fold hydrolase [Thermomicrobiales bacterium]
PLLVLLNGATTCKEELMLWSPPLIARGIAVLAIDWPGTGESASFTSPVADCDDLTDGVIALAADHPDLAEDLVVVGGISLGGGVALRCAVYDRRLLGAMAVTPPYDPGRWWSYVNPLVRMQLITLAFSHDRPEDIVSDFDLTDLVPRLQRPILCFGAGRDMVVPPDESVALASAAGDLATLVWYPQGGHCLYAELDDWLEITADWIHGLVGTDLAPGPELTHAGASMDDAPSSEQLAPVADETFDPAQPFMHTATILLPGDEPSTRVDSIGEFEDIPDLAEMDDPIEPPASADADQVPDDDDDLWSL